MKIQLENRDALNAEVSVLIGPEDYSAIVEKALKSLKSKVNVPGFRPGMVPVGIVKKLYGKAVLSDEVGKLTINALFNYLDEQKINFLGQPLPSLTKNQSIDWDTQKEFVFHYDLGLTPSFELTIPTDGFTSYKIEVSDEVLEAEINKLRDRNGRNINADVVEEKDFVMGKVVELDEAGNPKEDGINKTIYVFTDKIEDAAVKAELLGKKVEDVMITDVKKFYKDDVTAGIYLGLKAEDVANINSQFEFTITTINRMTPAAMDQEFFDKVFGEGVVVTEEEFRMRLREFLQNDLQAESNSVLLGDIRKAIIDANAFELPDEFLKRWLTVKNEDNKKVSVDEIINDYDNNKQYIRWEIIRNRIIEKYEVKLEEGELADAAKADVINRLTRMGYNLPPERVDEFAQTLLSNQEEAERLINGILETKALRKIREESTIAESSIGYNEYMEMLEKANANAAV